MIDISQDRGVQPSTIMSVSAKDGIKGFLGRAKGISAIIRFSSISPLVQAPVSTVKVLTRPDELPIGLRIVATPITSVSVPVSMDLPDAILREVGEDRVGLSDVLLSFLPVTFLFRRVNIPF